MAARQLGISGNESVRTSCGFPMFTLSARPSVKRLAWRDGFYERTPVAMDANRIDRKFPAIGFATSALQPRRRARVESRRRQQAAYKPDQSWKLLAEAAYWEHLAEVEVSSHFEECNPPGIQSFRTSPGRLTHGRLRN